MSSGVNREQAVHILRRTYRKIFVEKLLAPFLSCRGISVYTIMAARGIGGNKGGIAQYNQVKRELTNICNEHPSEHVTTLIDYSPVFGLPFDMIPQERFMTL